MNSSFSFSKYVGFVTAATWTFGWMLVASRVVAYLGRPDAVNTSVSIFVTFVAVAFGIVMTYRVYPRFAIPSNSKPAPRESWYRLITGWLGTVVWCAAGVLWNIAIFRVLLESAEKGRNANFIILIPFTAVGLMLLLMLFTCVALVLDSIFHLGDEARPEDRSN